jgi:hypothetical protein
MHVGSRRLIPGVPLLVLDCEGMRKVLHRRMIGGFEAHGARNEGGNVLRESDITHKTGEPRPHGKAIELAEECGMMEAI